MMTLNRFKRSAILLIAIIIAFVAPRAEARVFIVTTTQDTTDVTSLRGAIIAANAYGGKNIIILPTGNYQLNLYVYGVDEPAGYWGGLVIEGGDLTIIGKANAIIDASGLVGKGFFNNSVFQISTNTRVQLENLVITGGVGVGGGISNDGTLTLNGCKIEHNFCYTGGGGIYNAGSLSMTSCTVSDNSGGWVFSCDGGGIYNSGSLEMDGCNVCNNFTVNGLDGYYFTRGYYPIGYSPGVSGTDAGNGGGIYNSGDLSLNNSTITGNSCGAGGIGTYSYNTDAGNGGNGGNGAGIYNVGNLMTHRCAIYNNHSGTGGDGGNAEYDVGWPVPKDGNGGNGGNGGGIFNAAGASQARLVQTLVESNSAGLGGEPGATANPSLDGSGPNLFGKLTIRW